MTPKLFSRLTAATAATTLLAISAVAPAQAFMFGTNGIKFDKTTTVKFNFLESRGAYQSTLSVYDASKNLMQTLFAESAGNDVGSNRKNDSLGTAANLAGASSVVFTFEANKEYTLGLASLFNGSSEPTVYSTTALNAGTRKINGQDIFTQQAKFFNSDSVLSDTSYQNFFSSTSSALATTAGDTISSLASPVLIAFEDQSTRGHRDYNDLIVSAEEVPEPATMLGMGLVAGGMAVARRRRAAKAG